MWKPSKIFRYVFKSNFLIKNCCSLTSYALQYKEYGDPNTVLEKVELDVPDALESHEVLIKMLASPINPADINMVQGKYALKPKMPAIGGNEGVAEVIKVGPSVTKLKPGSWVIPSESGRGTWRTHALWSEEDLIQIDETLPLISAATLSVNPCTAYRMLKDFEDLKEGSTVIQNGANSAVGQAVIQLAKYFNINSINVVRDRPDLEKLRSHLTSLGATHVVVENELRSPVMADIFKKILKPSLALNCVGGKSVSELVRNMENGGTVVTYGGMSKQPIALSTASLIFNDMIFRGFWMTRWNQESSNEERISMLKEISDVIKRGGLKPPVSREVKFENFKDAVLKSMEPYVSEKQVLVME